MDLTVSNGMYDSELGAELYNRFLDEKIYAEEMGFDGLMLNEHHGTPFCMGGAMNVEASILARLTTRAKIVLLGNILPIWDDPLWLPGVVSRDSLMWAAKKRIPYIMLATEMEPTRQAFQLYHDTAAEEGYESGPQNIGYLWKVHVDETEDLAEKTGRKYVQGPSNPFLAGNEGTVNPALLALPCLTSRTRVLPTRAGATGAGGGMATASGGP